MTTGASLAWYRQWRHFLQKTRGHVVRPEWVLDPPLGDAGWPPERRRPARSLPKDVDRDRRLAQGEEDRWIEPCDGPSHRQLASSSRGYRRRSSGCAPTRVHFNSVNPKVPEHGFADL